MTDKRDDQILRDTIVKVDLGKLKHNMKLIKDMVGPDTAVMAVVKANGYGLGAVGIAPALMESGASYLAVATLSEAVELRRNYPGYPLFILGHTPDRFLHVVVEQNITQTIFSLEQAKIMDDACARTGKTAKVHIKVDTGFHRLGKMPSPEYAEEVRQICALEHIEVEGIFTHLALVNDEEDEKQYNLFMNFVEQLESMGCSFKYKHMADSIACVDFPKYRLDMIRPGALIYGMRGFHKGFLPVEQAISFSTRISQLHQVKAGEGVSYDYLWKAPEDSVIATLPFGYADGYPRNLRDKGYVIIRGQKAPLVGVLCMDQCMADVTDIPGVSTGDEAVIYGDGSDGSMTIEEASKLAGTNKNDIIARITARPPRVYTE